VLHQRERHTLHTMNNKPSKSRSSFNRRAGTSGTTMTSTVGGFPDHARVRLRYCTNVVRQPTVVTAADYVFRANGCFDPDVTSTGLQPANWDDWSAQYTRYRVWGSTLHYNIANSASGTLDLVTHVIGPRHTSTAVATQAAQENFQAQPYTKVGKSIVYNNGSKASDQIGSISMSTEKFLGLSRQEFLGNDDLTALVSADPAHQWFWHLCFSVDDQTSTCNMYINVCIEYDVEFWDRVDTTLDLKYERLLANRRIKAEADLKQPQSQPSTHFDFVELPQGGESKHSLPSEQNGGTRSVVSVDPQIPRRILDRPHLRSSPSLRGPRTA
jgi:hypothetical protein